MTQEDQIGRGRLLARPGPGQPDAATGLQRLPLEDGREVLLYVPQRHHHCQPAALALMLHGAGGSATDGMGLLQPVAELVGLLVVAPQSHGRTWDVILRDYGPDVALIDQALDQVFDQYLIDPAHLAIGGFSDGASYALSLGITNGDVFSHVLAFAPGFAAPADVRGSPRLYIAHGTRDTVLPIDRCGRRLADWYSHNGYDLHYHEFDGGHTVPPEIALEALQWFLE
ncbi:MAG: serine esterase [Roseiflexaceae bacterium]